MPVRLVLAVAVAVALMAIAPSAASAEIAVNTEVFTGPVDATITDVSFDGLLSVTCDGDLEVSVDGENDAGTMNSVSVVNCSPACAVTVNGTPYDFTVDSTDGTVVVTDAINLTATCSFLTCTLAGASNGLSGEWDIGLETVALQAEVGGNCGTGTVSMRIRIRRTANPFFPGHDLTPGITPNTTGLFDGGTVLRWIDY